MAVIVTIKGKPMNLVQMNKLRILTNYNCKETHKGIIQINVRLTSWYLNGINDR